MIRKAVFIFSFVLAQTADKLLDFLWLYYIYAKTHQILYVAIFAAVIVVGRLIIFLTVREMFHKSSFYGHYILAYSFAFLAILLVNKLSIESIIFLLIVLKEIFSAFRVTGTKAYLNHIVRGRKWLLLTANSISYVVYPLAILLLKFFIDKQIIDQTFTAFALLIAPAMILTFRLYSKTHKFLAEKDLRINLNESLENSTLKRLIQLGVIVIWPIVQVLFYVNFVYGLKNGFRFEFNWASIALLVSILIAIFIYVIDSFDKTSKRYAEYSGKIAETIIFFLTAVIFFILG
jgi:hypothetical protein